MCKFSGGERTGINLGLEGETGEGGFKDVLTICEKRENQAFEIRTWEHASHEVEACPFFALNFTQKDRGGASFENKDSLIPFSFIKVKGGFFFLQLLVASHPASPFFIFQALASISLKSQQHFLLRWRKAASNGKLDPQICHLFPMVSPAVNAGS